MKTWGFAVLAAVLAAGLWLVAPGPSRADYSDWCGTPLLAWPVKVGVVYDQANGLVRLCYSTAPSGAPVSGGMVHAGPQVLPGAGAVVHVGCGQDTGTAVGLSCDTHTGGGVQPAYQQGVGQVYRLTLNYTVCPVTGCTGGSQAVADWTGVVVGSFGVVSPPSGTSTGAMVYADSFYACVNGVCTELVDTMAGAGTNTDAVRTAVGWSNTCVLSVCLALPSSASAAYTGASLLTLHALGQSVPVYVPGGAQCLARHGEPPANWPC